MNLNPFNFYLALLFLTIFATFTHCTFTVNGRNIMLNGVPHFIQGVCYYPIPIGYSPAVKYEQYGDNPSDRQVWERDLNMISAMGANTIRMYGFDNNVDHSAFFDYALSKGIQVLVQYWWDTGKLLTDPTIKAGFINMITKQQHPAVGMWIIHNELNFKYTLTSELDLLYDLFDNMVDEVIKIEGPNHRPVVTTLANTNNVVELIKRYNNRKLSAWAVQLYNGKSFGTFFKDYSAISSKPLIVTEFGIDAYDDTRKVVDENTQREYDVALMQELYDNSGVTSGGTVFSYVDELHKCGNDNQYDTCSSYNQAFPDERVNEEYFGLYWPTKNGNGADILNPRPVVSAISTLWKSHLVKAKSAATTTSQIIITSQSTTSDVSQQSATDFNQNNIISAPDNTKNQVNNSLAPEENINNSLKLISSLLILYLIILFV